MTAPPFGFLNLAQSRPVYIIDHAVLASPSPRRSSVGLRPVASLEAEAKAAVRRLPWPTGGDPLSARASDHLAHLGAFQFCLGRLVPYMRSLVDRHADPRCPPELQEMLTRLSGPARDLKPHADAGREDAAITPDRLAELLGAPCEIFKGKVVPLEQISPSGKVTDAVSIAGRHFVRRNDRSRLLAIVLRSIEAAMRSHLAARPTEKPDPDAAAFLALTAEIIDLHRPVKRRGYLELYRDRHHRLQYNRARFLVVRGPLRNWDQDGGLFLALPILGTSRRELLRHAPAVAAGPDDFWTRGEIPYKGGICMGDRGQYSRLHSNLFTDVEAVVQWLDAAAIVSTGRSLLFRELRCRRFPRRLRHRLASAERPL